MSFLALSGIQSSLVQTFGESCVHIDVTHPAVHMTWRFVIQGRPTHFLNQHGAIGMVATVQ